MALVCPQCKGRGMIAKGQAVQYCMCDTGRAKKKCWLEIAVELRAEEEKISPTLPDLDDLRGVA